MLHIPADPDGLAQHCDRCGTLLLDFSPDHHSHHGAARMTDAAPTFWPVGRLVEQVENRVQTYDGPADQSKMCTRTG